MTTTAQMSVGIDTSQAKIDLQNLRKEMEGSAHKILINVDPTSVDQDIQRYLKQRTFKIKVDTSEMGREIANDVGVALDRAFNKPDRSLAWNQAALRGGMNAAMSEVFNESGRRLLFDRTRFHDDINEVLRTSFASPQNLHINTELLTTQIRDAVSAGLALARPMPAPLTPVGRPAAAAAAATERAAAEPQGARAAPPIDARALLGLPTNEAVQAAGNELRAIARTAVDFEAIRPRPVPTTSAAALLGLPSLESIRETGAALRAEVARAINFEGLQARPVASLAVGAIGAAAGAAPAPAAPLATAAVAPELVSSVKLTIREVLTPAVDEMVQAATAIAAAARRATAGAGAGGSGTLKASESISRKDAETGKTVSVRRSLENPEGYLAEAEAAYSKAVADKQTLVQERAVLATKQSLLDQKLKEIGQTEASQERERLTHERAVTATQQALLDQRLKEIGQTEASQERERLTHERAVTATQQALLDQRLKEIGQTEASQERERLTHERAVTATQQALLDQRLKEIGQTEASQERERLTHERAVTATQQALLDQKLKEIGETEASQERARLTHERAVTATQQALLDQKLREIGKAEADLREQSLSQVRTRYASLKMDAGDRYTGTGAALVASRQVKAEYPDLAEAALPRNTHLFESTVDAQKYAKAVADIKPPVDATKEAHKQLTGVMNEAHSAARGLAGSMGAMWATYGSVIPMVLFASLGAAMKGVYDEGKKVEYQLAFIKGLANESLTQKDVEGAVAGSMQSPGQALEGLRALTQSGLTAKEALGALPDVLSLATVGETSVGDAAFAATGVVKAFGLEINEIGRVSDVLAKSAAVSNASVTDMMAGFKYASASSSMYGASLEETGAALAMLAEKNIKGSMAGTAHMNLLKEIYTPTKKSGEAFKALGLDMEGMQRKGYSSVEMLDAIRAATSKLDSTGVRTFAQAIGGERGMRELAPLLEGGTKKLVDMQHELENSRGFTKSVMLELQNTVEGSSQRMKQSLTFALSGAFEDARGPVQNFQNTIATALGSDSFKADVTQIAQGVVALTRFLFDHAEAIKLVGLAYISLKGISVVTSAMGSVAASMASVTAAAHVKVQALAQSSAALEIEAVATQQEMAAEMRRNIALTETIALERAKSGAMASSTVATEAATLATAENTVAQVAASGGMARLATGVGTISAYTGVWAGALGLASRGLSAILGPISLVIATVTTLYSVYEILTAKQNGARDAQDSYTNYVASTVRVLDQEIERLEKKKYLLDHPGKSDVQGSLEQRKSSIQKYIDDVSSAYNYDKGPDGGHRGQVFKITGVDGVENTYHSGSELATLFATLAEKKKDLLNITNKATALTASEAVVEQRTAQQALVKSIDGMIDSLAMRRSQVSSDKSKIAEIDKAVVILRAYESPEALAGVKTSQQAEGIEKSLRNTVNTSGDKFVMPPTPKTTPQGANKAQYHGLLDDLNADQKEVEQYIKFRKQLDDAKYNPKLYGDSTAASVQEQRQLTDTTLALKAEGDAINRLGIARAGLDAKYPLPKDKPGLDAAIIGIDNEIAKRIERFKVIGAELEQSKLVAKQNAETREQIEAAELAQANRKASANVDESIVKIRQGYSTKVESPAAAVGTKAATKAEAEYLPIITKQETDVETREASINRLLADRAKLLQAFTPLDTDRLERLDAALGSTRDELTVAQERLATERSLSLIAGAKARTVGTDEFNKSQTAEYGFRKYFEEYQSSAQSSAQIVQDLMKKSTDGMSASFGNFVTGAKSGFKSMVASLLADAARAMANKALSSLLGMVVNYALGAATGAASGYTSEYQGSGFAQGSNTNYGNEGGNYKFAHGGVMTGDGPVELKKYANGGVAHGTQIEEFGESSLPEANVPLADGRSIPVTLQGGQGGGGDTSVNIAVNIDSNGKSQVESDSSGKKAAQLGKMVEDNVLTVIQREKRPGGLLYA